MNDLEDRPEEDLSDRSDIPRGGEPAQVRVRRLIALCREHIQRAGEK